MLLELENLTKTYQAGPQTVRAVDGVSLQMNAGDFIAIQGPSGCGKTTLLLVTGTLLAPDSGTVRIAGETPYSFPPERRAAFRAEKMGFVFQQFHLVPYLSVLDNILAPSLATGNAAELRDRGLALMAEFGLEGRQHHVPGQLSTGERQRTALARALLHQPALLLADEPTGNLDRENSDVVLEHLQKFAEQGGAVLMVTHDSYAAEKANRVEQFLDGKFASHASSTA